MVTWSICLHVTRITRAGDTSQSDWQKHIMFTGKDGKGDELINSRKDFIWIPFSDLPWLEFYVTYFDDCVNSCEVQITG